MEIILGVAVLAVVVWWVIRRENDVKIPRLNLGEVPLWLKSKPELIEIAASYGIDPKGLVNLSKASIIHAIRESQGD